MKSSWPATGRAVTFGLMTHDGVLIYGSNRYTGRLIAARALERGVRPVLAGRSAAAIRQQAADLGLEHRIFSLDDASATADGPAEMRVVMHCAGPLSRTSAPMAGACLRSGTHHLDITGEIAVFEVLAGGARAGFQPPSLAFGADFLMEIDGVRREDAS